MWCVLLRGFGEHPQRRRRRLQTSPVVGNVRTDACKDCLRVFRNGSGYYRPPQNTSHAHVKILTGPRRRPSPASNNRCARRGASSRGARRFQATGSRASRASTASHTPSRAWCIARGIGVDSAGAAHRAYITTPEFAEDRSVRTTKRCGGGSGVGVSTMLWVTPSGEQE